MSLVFGARLCWGGGGVCDIPWYTGFRGNILYHWHPHCTSGPRWDVACSVAKAFSCDMFAGLPGALLPGASLMTQFAHSSWRVQM